MTRGARPFSPVPGSPLVPTGDPMIDGVGPAAWAEDRADRCDLTLHGEPRIRPMRVVAGVTVHPKSPDPRGMRVVGTDGVVAGTVVDIWVDLAEPYVRYLTVLLADGSGEVLLPMGYARVVRATGTVHVKAIRAAQFARVPRPKAADRITLLEEDKVVAYYAGGYMYAEPSRQEPLF